MAGPAFGDVPDRYDVVFQINNGNTYGFLLADSLESNLPFRTHKALYGYSPTFLERENVSNTYGDNFQDFFLTGAQNDFSLGEQQRYFRVTDADSSKRYWDGLNIDPTSLPGTVTLTPTLVTQTITNTSYVACPAAAIQNNGYTWFAADTNNLYGVASNGAFTSLGSHGTSSVGAVCADPSNIYIASNAGGGIRKFHLTGSVFSTFSTVLNITQMVYLNNTIYVYQYNNDCLISLDSAGNPTTQFQWKNGDGSTVSVAAQVKLIPYGGSIYILRNVNTYLELWKYDGTGCSMLAQFPPDFVGQSIAIAAGIVFVSGTFAEAASFRPAVFYYVNGSVGQLWKSPVLTTNSNMPLTAFGNGIIFKDPVTGNILQYDLAFGGVHTIENFVRGGSPEPSSVLLGSNISSGFLLLYSDRSVVYGSTTNYNSTGNLKTSLYDFDNTLTKVFRGIKIDADLPANTSVDIAYQLNGVTGAYTNLQTGAATGTEYFLPAATTGQSISVRITLNSATGANTPTLKRVYIRAAPTLQQFRYREFIFDLSGGYRSTKGKVARVCRDGTPYPYDSLTAAQNLITIATQIIPFTVQDRFGQYTALADLQQNSAGFDGFAIYEIHPGVYLARINLREV